jgi:hypothetical protein
MKKLTFLMTLVFVGCTSQTKQAPPAPMASPAATPMAQNTQPSGDHPKLSCSKGTDKREFEIEKKGNGCVFRYTQGGKAKEETVTTHGLKQCEMSEKKMLLKLKKSGFKCS